MKLIAGVVLVAITFYKGFIITPENRLLKGEQKQNKTQNQNPIPGNQITR